MLLYEKDDFLGPQEFKYIQDSINGISWYYREDIVFRQMNGTCFGFHRPIFDEDGVHIPGLYEMSVMLTTKLLDQNNLKLKQLRRIRLGMFTKYSQPVQHDAHVDYEDPHYTALFYLNTNNGYTSLYKKVKTANKPWLQDRAPSPEELGQEYQILPKANKMVLFDGLRYHSSSTQTDNNLRIVMNINFTADKC
jgi:hypothetical protein